jgi:DNA-binding response OmpR family regulator
MTQTGRPGAWEAGDGHAPILVVEDEADLAATCERLLRRHGHQVATAGTREQALAALGARPFTLVICDMRLPDGDGLDIVAAARSTPRPIPVIVITGFPSEAGRRAALAAGAAAYVAKPFSLTLLLEQVQRLLPGTTPQ